MENWKLFLDDIRLPAEKGFILARSVADAKYYIEQWGCPSFISFDHDLGSMGYEKDFVEESGYYLAKWLVYRDAYSPNFIPENFDFTVHSQNPVGAENIRTYLNNYLRWSGKKCWSVV